MKKLGRLRKSKTGMTLVELVVAITLISIVFASAMSAIVHSYMSVVKNKNIEQASMQAKGVADTVVSSINSILSDSSVTDKDTAIINAIDASGLKTANGYTYYDRISTPTASWASFPNTSSGLQVTVEKISSLDVTKNAVNSSFNGYKVMVAAPCDNSYDKGSYVTITATSIEYK